MSWKLMAFRTRTICIINTLRQSVTLCSTSNSSKAIRTGDLKLWIMIYHIAVEALISIWMISLANSFYIFTTERLTNSIHLPGKHHCNELNWVCLWQTYDVNLEATDYCSWDTLHSSCVWNHCLDWVTGAAVRTYYSVTWRIHRLHKFGIIAQSVTKFMFDC